MSVTATALLLTADGQLHALDLAQLPQIAHQDKPVSAANVVAQPALMPLIMSAYQRLHSTPIVWAPVLPVTRASLITFVTATVILLTGDGHQSALRIAQVQQIVHQVRPVLAANVAVRPAVILLIMSAVSQPWASRAMPWPPALQDTPANLITSVTAVVMIPSAVGKLHALEAAQLHQIAHQDKLVLAANAVARPVLMLQIMSAYRRLHSPPIVWAPVLPVTRASLITSVTATVILLTGDGIQNAQRVAQVQQIAHQVRPVIAVYVDARPAVMLLIMSAVSQP